MHVRGLLPPETVGVQSRCSIWPGTMGSTALRGVSHFQCLQQDSGAPQLSLYKHFSKLSTPIPPLKWTRPTKITVTVFVSDAASLLHGSCQCTDWLVLIFPYWIWCISESILIFMWSVAHVNMCNGPNVYESWWTSLLGSLVYNIKNEVVFDVKFHLHFVYNYTKCLLWSFYRVVLMP